MVNKKNEYIMKNLNQYILKFGIFLVLFGFVSCEDEEVIRIPEAEKIVNLRIQRDVTSFDSTDPNAAVELTMYTESTNISTVEMFVSHFYLVDNEEGDQYKIGSTLNGNEIGNDGSTVLNFTLVELTAAMGEIPADLAGGDAVNIYSIVTLTDGSVYPDTVRANADLEFINVSPTIINASATSSFSPKLVFPILCEMPETFGSGIYLFEVIEGDNLQFGIPTFDDPALVEITATSSTERTFQIGYLTGFGFGTTAFNFTFACNAILLEPTGAGLGCGGGGLAWDLNKNDVGTFDITDDSEFTISILHNIFGDCGIAADDPIKFRLTRQ
jgi:hypothetical protein